MMRPETLTYEADGLTMKGDLYAAPGSERRPGVLVFPEAFGLGDHARERARRLAEVGFVALACDLHGGARLIDDLQEAIGLIKPLQSDPTRTRVRSKAALDVLLATGRVEAAKVAAIGFCFGGTMALELARSGAELAAAVGFHSGLGSAQPATAGAIKAKVLVCIGGDDPMIDGDARRAFEEEMKVSGCDWQMHVYGNTVHSFTNTQAAKRGMPDAIRYSEDADNRSWAAMTELFAEVLR